MSSIKNRVAKLEKKVGLDSVQVDPQYDFLSAERFELAVACSKAFQAGRESDVQELQKKLADNAKALWAYRKCPYPLPSLEALVEALEREQ